MDSSATGLPQKPDEESVAKETRQPSDMWAVLPEQLRSVTVATEFSSERHRWNTNEEVASLLVAFDKHQQWLQKEVAIRPPSGTLLFYSKQNQRYRKDGYFWKKRRDGKTTREDHMKLKVSGVECIYGCYVHSAILPTFHRRSYWLLQNPDIVLVHYLNLPLSEETPLPPLTIQPHKQQWEEGQLLAQLRPMFARSGPDCNTSVSEETIQSIASSLLENQRRVECSGGGSLCKARSPAAQTLTYLSHKAATSRERASPASVLVNQTAGSKAPLILNLSQLQANSSLIILSSAARPGRPMTIISGGGGGVHRPGEADPKVSRVQTNHKPSEDLGETQPGHKAAQFVQGLAPRDTNPTPRPGRTSTRPPHRQDPPPSHNTTSNGGFVATTSQLISHSVPHLSQTTHVARQPTHPPLVSAADMSVVPGVYHPHLNGTGTDLPSHSLYSHNQVTTAAIPCIGPSSRGKPHVSNHVNHAHTTFSGSYANPVSVGENGSVYNHIGPYGTNHYMSNHAGTNGDLGGHMSPHAIAQVAESDMVVDSLIREMNLQQGAPGVSDTMQISPSQSDLTLDDLDLSFLDSVPSPAASVATYSSPAPPMVTSPSPPAHRGVSGGSAIVEVCPAWAYKEGGEKVLIIGPWCSDKAGFAVLFDGVAVPAQLLQGGVLRCICPEHKPGRVKVEVVSTGHVISDSVLFEYRSRLLTDNKDDSDWFNVKELQMQTWLLQRLQLLEKTIDPGTSASLSAAVIMAPRREESEYLELRLIECVQQLSEKTWPLETRPIPPATRGLTLLHLAAGLGYASLINCLIGWRRDNQTSILMAEVDAVATDEHQATPLVWACAFGHQEAASVLYQYNSPSLTLCTRYSQNAIDLAKQNGHLTIASKLTALEKARLKSPALNGKSPSKVEQHKGKDCSSVLGTLDPQGLQTGINAMDPKSCESVQRDLAGHACKSCEVFGGPVADLDAQGFKIPASPLHSTPKHQERSRHMDSLSVSIPTPDLPHKGRRAELLKRLSVEVLPNHPSKPDPADSHQVRARSLTLEERSECTYHSAQAGWPGEGAPRYEDIHQGRAKSLTLEEASDPHLTDPRLTDPRLTDPRLTDPRLTDPRLTDPRLTDPRLTDPRLSAWGQEIHNDPMLSMNCRDLNSPVMFMAVDAGAGFTLEDLHQHTAMETESSCHSTSASSQADRDDHLLDSASQDPSGEGGQGNHQMATLANQIIAAMPERIKLSPSRSDEHPQEEVTSRRDRSSSYGSFSSCSSSAEVPCAEDSGISTPLEGIAEDYRYVELTTPPSSVSPTSSLHSPYVVDGFSLDSPPPTAQEFHEYFNAPMTYLEKDFSQLTLSDTEQRNLYAAAKIIQNFYRKYKDRKEQQMLQRQREVEAVVLIQSYYRRYKQYRYYKKMSQAAVLIQSQFRSYYAQKCYRQRREAATLIQNRYRAYKEQKRFRKRKDAAVLIQQRFRNHYHRKYHKNQKSGQPDTGSDSPLWQFQLSPVRLPGGASGRQSGGHTFLFNPF